MILFIALLIEFKIIFNKRFNKLYYKGIINYLKPFDQRTSLYIVNVYLLYCKYL